MRVSFGPGYRLYYKTLANVVILLLTGGDKSSQAQDIEKAKHIAQDWGK